MGLKRLPGHFRFGMGVSETYPWRIVGLDGWLLTTVLLVMLFGLLMVASASMPLAVIKSGQPFHYLIRQGIYDVLAIGLAGLVLMIPLRKWYAWGPSLLLLSVLLLCLVLIPGIGSEVNGSFRWISLGVINLQASELAKLFTLIYLSGYLKRYHAQLPFSVAAMMKMLVVLGILSFLLLLEPDYGSIVVLLVSCFGMILLAGIHMGHFIALLASAACLMSLLLYFSDYRRARLLSFIDPWANAQEGGWQLTGSLIAVGRGELFGVGLGASVQKTGYLPEAHTDFIFAIIAEELGFVGVVAVVAMYAVIIWRIFVVLARARRLRMTFAASLAAGVGLWLAIQTLFNMGVNLGLLPTKGLTLPLISYGGSSMVTMTMGLAIVLRADYETRSADPEVRREKGE